MSPSITVAIDKSIIDTIAILCKETGLTRKYVIEQAVLYYISSKGEIIQAFKEGMKA